MRSVPMLALVALALAACSFSRGDHAQACESDRDCAGAAHCSEGFCLALEPQRATCSQSNQIESCYDGVPATSADVGSCKAGQRFCVEGTYSECLGQVLPAEEVCNGRDDDCDGEIDDVMVSSTCDTLLRGACSAGMRRCRDGIEFCEPTTQSQIESCNGIDDDCDGAIDELVTGACYPAGATGCTVDSEGVWHCKGQCTTGQLSCDGSTEACLGAITPAEEQCTSASATFAQDENCDGEIDEGCICSDGTVRDCYAGPIGTRDRGVCAPGSQTCEGSSWGDCVGQTLPSVESCDNMGHDDDCNGVVDDVIGMGLPCIASEARGECRNGTFECTDDGPACVAGEASKELCDELDQDCDGNPTNGFDFNTSETCGSCDVQCASTQTCCEGHCIARAALEDDPDNCGACGRRCGAGSYCCQGDCLAATGPKVPACACDKDCGSKSCCGKDCRDLDSDKGNCGACGRKCGPDEKCVAGMCKR